MQSKIRSIKPDFFRHFGLFQLEKETHFPMRTAFSGLWTVADREGRFRWKPEDLKHDVLPYDEVDFSAVLEALARAGFIVRYECGGKPYGYIPTWSEHQRPNYREAQSKIPSPSPDEPDDENSPPSLFNNLTRGADCAGGIGSGIGSGIGRGEAATPAPTVEIVLEKSKTDPPLSKSTPQTYVETPTPRGLSELEYARKLLDDLGLPARGNIVVVAESIRAFSNARASPLPAAFEQIRAIAFEARGRGDPIDFFWFQDGRYSQPKVRSKSDVATEQYADRLERELAIGRRANRSSN